MTYNETLQYLYASQPAFHQVGATAYKPGLANTYRLMEHLGNPHTQFRSVHIAGTNGKGSTSHLIAAVLQSAGYKVGLYTSPHLVDFRERIRINGQMILEAEVVRFVADNQAFLEEVRPSFFETTMALAFAYFAAEKVDIAVIEVGLGGRLDSTNIITPELSVITNIGMDHTEFLGNTLQQIASEKAGIIKPHIPVIIGETHPDTAPVFIQTAQEHQAPITFADTSRDVIPLRLHPTSRDALLCVSPNGTTVPPDLNNAVETPFMASPSEQKQVETSSHGVSLPCQLQGTYQHKNKQTAYCALQVLSERGWSIPQDAIRQGYAQVCTLTGLRGRWEILSQSPLTICDTGHNSHGIRYVADQLHQLLQDGSDATQSLPLQGESEGACRSRRGLYIVFGMVNDKDVDIVLSLLPKQATYFFTQAQTHRAIPAHTLQQLAAHHHLQGTAYPTTIEALQAAQAQAQSNDIIFIGGSNYIVGEALQAF